jgi:hypothetical protein
MSKVSGYPANGATDQGLDGKPFKGDEKSKGERGFGKTPAFSRPGPGPGSGKAFANSTQAGGARGFAKNNDAKW